MGQPKGKSGNYKGRTKGSQNKVTIELKTWINELIDSNRAQFEKDLKAIDPEKRLAIIEKLMNYCIPKMQSVSIEAQIQAEYSELEKLLQSAPEEAIDKITERIITLKNQSNE